MAFYLKTHIVEKGETIEDILSRYSIPSVEMLRYFHHKNAPKGSGSLGFTLSPGQEILIPGKEDIDKIMSERKTATTEFSYSERILNQDLKFPFVSGNHRYKVSLQEEDCDDVDSFFLDINHLKKENGLHHLTIRQSEILKNENKDPDCVELLALEINESVYPLKIAINEKGIIQKINEMFILRKKWNDKKSDLYEFFPRELGKKMLNPIEEDLSDPENLAYKFNLSIPWGLLFRGIIGKYEHGKCERKINMMDGDSDLSVINTVVEKSLGNDPFFEIRQKIFDENNSGKIKADAAYTLYKKTNMVFQAKVDLYDMPEHLHLKMIKTE